ncbi:MAG: hypothetical protein ABFD10_04990 [Prolixibacteraceae bacterium]
MKSRRKFIRQTAVNTIGLLSGTQVINTFIAGCDRPKNNRAIKAYCIDFNWGPGGRHGFAKPGLWADANPEEHVRWYRGIGCNTIQTFAVSCNGYSWYKNGFTPEQPGLKHDFLTEMVNLGHKAKMNVFGYFCAGANNKWEEDHPELTYQMSGQQIPYTNQYLDYLCASIEDAIKKTDMDGFMLDWLYNPGGSSNPLPPLRWIKCEQEMYRELMDSSFPRIGEITPSVELGFRKKAIERAWQRIKTSAKNAKPDCMIWLTAYEVNSQEYQGVSLLKEADWLMNEAGDIERTKMMRDLAGSNTKLITCLANWNRQDPVQVVSAAVRENIGLYGFTKPVIGSMMKPVDFYLSNPINSLDGDERSIAIFSRVFNQLPLDYVQK